MNDIFSTLPGFSSKSGIALCESISLMSLAHRFGTPLYVYSRQALETAYSQWEDAVSESACQLFYAVKANSSLAILNLFARRGCGFDIVSAGELARVIAAGADPKKIVYSGVGKTESEIEEALTADILCFNIESSQELVRIQSVAARLNKKARISIRVNPDVDAKTHPYISTGLKNNKFGVAYEQAPVLYLKASNMPNIEISGIDCHIGSQITDIAPYLDACDKLLDLVETLRTYGIGIDHIDMGGGLGVCYTDEQVPSPRQLVEALHKRCQQRGFGQIPLFFEPGRSLVANAGVLLTTVQYLKPTPFKNFCIVDAAMNDMIRPTLYQAVMNIENTMPCAAAPEKWNIVGPVCESGDWLGQDRELCIQSNDVLVMTSAGAYGMSMASNYNTRPRAAEIMVDGLKTYIIREREQISTLMLGESCLP